MQAVFWKAFRGTVLLCVLFVTLYFSVISTAPLPDHPLLRGHNDTFLHIVSFGLLSFLALLGTQRWPIRLVVLSLVAVGIETIQIWEPRRTASFSDLAASLAGIALGAGIAWLANKLLGRIFAASKQ